MYALRRFSKLFKRWTLYEALTECQTSADLWKMNAEDTRITTWVSASKWGAIVILEPTCILHQQKSHNSKKKEVNWREQRYVSVAALSVANLLCPDKRSLVCGSGEELAEDPLTLSAMKSPAYAPDLLLENCDQMVLCTANHTQTGFSI